MTNIAIVEDNVQEAQTLSDCLLKYAAQFGLQFQITTFANAVLLLDDYKPSFDLIFMDIKLPLLSGMDAAKQLRQLDRRVTLVFVTNMLQYAIDGYAVEAFDFILKPISYQALSLKLKRILAHVGVKTDDYIVLRAEGEPLALKLSQIRYVEVEGHYLNWYLQGKVYRTPGALKSLGQQLPDSYAPISRWCVVNMQYIQSVLGDDVLLSEGQKLRIGRAYKQQFLRTYAEFMVGGL